MSFGNERPFIDFLQQKERKEVRKLLCPFLMAADRLGECQAGKCARYDLGRSQCVDISTFEALTEIWSALDNLAREINRSVLRRPA